MWLIGGRAGELGRRQLQAERRRHLAVHSAGGRCRHPARAGLGETTRCASCRRRGRHARPPSPRVACLPRSSQEVGQRTG